jgi:hypothetical protein
MDALRVLEAPRQAGASLGDSDLPSSGPCAEGLSHGPVESHALPGILQGEATLGQPIGLARWR